MRTDLITLFESSHWQEQPLEELLYRGCGDMDALAYTPRDLMNHMTQWFEGLEEAPENASLYCYQYPGTLMYILRLWFGDRCIGTLEINRRRLRKGPEARRWPTPDDYHMMELDKICVYLRGQIRFH